MNWVNKWNIFISKMSQSTYINLLIQGLQTTVQIAVLGLIIGIVIGTVIAAIKVAPKYKLIMRILEKICDFYTALFRGTPMMVQLLITYYVLLPMMGVVGVDKVMVGTIVFGMNSGAYVSEIMRSGIQAVDPGQMEAGRAVGLSFAKTMITIIIPQAIKNILPTLGNEFISLIKETSVLSFITVIDLYKALNTIATANQQYEYVMPYLFLGIIYIILVLLITLLVKVIENIMNKTEKRTQK